jgi:GrpB-like predicted nucleotidyltransferase (UPF0157 family)
VTPGGAIAGLRVHVVRATSCLRLHDNDPRWPEQIAREEQRIRRALGDGVLRLEHVGSTSVPGLVAKPRIDILLVVSDPAVEPS